MLLQLVFLESMQEPIRQSPPTIRQVSRLLLLLEVHTPVKIINETRARVNKPHPSFSLTVSSENILLSPFMTLYARRARLVDLAAMKRLRWKLMQAEPANAPAEDLLLHGLHS